MDREFKVLSSRLPFGLNFERHRPEAVELPQLPIRKGDKVRVLPNRQVVADEMAIWEHHLEDQIDCDTSITSTEREALILARRGQGRFRERVSRIERMCRITRVDNPEHLRASHAKPWRDCISNDERLNGENGLLLTPSIDHLFDRGFITFEDSGQLVLSPVADTISLERMGVPTNELVNVGSFTEGQRHFLDYHRNSVFLAARR